MEKARKNLAACMLLLALAGTLAASVPYAAAERGILPQYETTVTGVTGENSCMKCLEECDAAYADSPGWKYWCRFSCGIGTCRIPPSY